MNRSTYRFGSWPWCRRDFLFWGCGPSNPDQLSLRLSGFWSAPLENDGSCNLAEAQLVSTASGSVAQLYGVPCFYVEFMNFVEGTEDSSPNAALGNVVLEKVQVVARIRGTGMTLPTTTVLTSTNIEGNGSSVLFGMPVLTDEQVTALYSNESSLPDFPFDIDLTYTGFARYAGSEYRATGGFTVAVTGF